MADAPPLATEASLGDLRTRLQRYRSVELVPGHGWDRGVDLNYLQDLVEY
jgi:hypothetical protein